MTEDKPRKSRTTDAFFGRRKGKALRPKQAAQTELVRARQLIDLSKPAPDDLTNLFSVTANGVRLEIGFGGGEHLHHESGRFPKTGFIGVEPFVNGFAKLAMALDEEDRPNLRLYDDDATWLLDWLPDNTLDGIDLLYPDPWPKKRHWKRRFVNDANLDRFARVLKRGGLFRFASDIDTYVNWTLEHCRRHGAFEWLATGPENWRTPYEAWPGTRYEAKAIREGRTPSYLTFRRI
ncbi:tRNA (guanosine(46)-N(7))-methyltransferase TrmB [Notoacmeibacter sp. MSK16QG-6]|uniref:tRNA (guanine(46)-N(7))-methyltransferase TrmB n=1 Tax=Notoacmeibacter sp. MSK16QG-6 TaxID=2957982 RepID=UPI0020A116FF|nr:tRNA (guanine(46)-N(7))-methyltransferase TrmB [Notoacmeibacter sp. MSK16QG-6]MCP1198800.1 tRNA (guanine(46)-N(7))-methyltransferase TrmB [Notoacmeibacter sp. MSK16QG-6]